MRWALWATALAAIGSFALFTEDPEQPDVVAPIAATGSSGSKPRVQTTALASTSLQWHYLASRTRSQEISEDLFKAEPLASPQPAAVAPEPLPEPQASIPPAPFQYLGKLDIDGAHPLIFLTDGVRVYSLVPGQTINASWRLDADAPQTLHLTYLPLNAAQVLSKSNGSAVPQEQSQGVPG